MELEELAAAVYMLVQLPEIVVTEVLALAAAVAAAVVDLETTPERFLKLTAALEQAQGGKMEANRR